MSQRRPGSSRWLALVWCLAGVAACGSTGRSSTDGPIDRQGAAGDQAAGGSGGSSAAGTSGGGGFGGGGGTGFFPGCHHDCGGGIWCMAGVVTIRQTVGVPCESWTGSCPGTTYTCPSKGCLVEGSYSGPVPLASPYLLCAAAKVGDSCSESGLCLPTPATDGPDGGLTTTHLDCDPSTKKCVVAAGPTGQDFGAPCWTGFAPLASGSGYAFDTMCAKESCFRFADPAAGCTRSGCTASCSGDHDCPSGWFCDPTVMRLPPLEVVTSSICRPGPRGGVPKTLACPSP